MISIRNNIEIIEIIEINKCEVVVLMMWLSFWHSQRTLGLTALSLTPSVMVPPLHVERSSSEPLHPPRNCYSQYKQR